MIRGISIIMVSLVFSLIGYSQVKPIWDTALYSGNPQPELLVLESGYVTMVNDNDDWNTLNIWELDLSGKVIDTNKISFPSTIANCGKCLEQLDSSSYVLANTLFVSNDSAHVQLIKLNRQWDTVKVKHYFYNDIITTQTDAMRLVQDSLILVTGYTFPSTTANRYDLLLACFDTSFNLLWEKSYNRPGSAVGGYWGFDIESTTDNGFLIGALDHNFPSSPAVNKGFMVKVDSVGNLMWSKTLYPKPGNILTGGLQFGKRQDGDYVFVTEEVLNNDLSRLRFGIVNETGQILKDTLIGPAIDEFGTFAFTPTADGHFVVGGESLEHGWRGHAYKFTEDGDSIWHRFYYYGDPQDGSTLYNFQATPDSGLIMAGAFFDSYNNPTSKGVYNWLLKVDKHGCDSVGCHTIGLAEFPLSEVKLQFYPNPASHLLNLEWSQLRGFTEGNLELEIYSMLGQKLVNESLSFQPNFRKELDVSRLKPGNYLLKVYDETRVWESSVLGIID